MEMGSQPVEEEEEEEEEEEDYISMEITPYSPQSKDDFEFQHFSSSASAASDLFYRGKLLPLPLPPHRHMVEHLIRTPPPFLTFSSTAPCTTSNTPSDSCNISPSDSCRASCDLNSGDAALFEWPTDIAAFFHNNNSHTQPRISSWSKKLKMKLNKRSYLAHKLKSSRAYLKSLFIKEDNISIGRKFATLIKKNAGVDDHSHRRSFSGAISAADSSSSSSSSSSSNSFSSRGPHEVRPIRRSSSAAEIEVSIDAAIAHCKKSLQI